MKRLLRFVRRLPLAAFLAAKRGARAWRYHRALKYSWNVAWMKAGYGMDEHADVKWAGTL
jgi:hypothetical protein